MSVGHTEGAALRAKQAANDFPTEGIQAKITAVSFAEIFVLCVWFVLTAMALGYVFKYGSPLPFFDDLGVLSSFATEPRGSWQWIMRPHNGHLFPLERLVVVGNWLATHGNLRPVLFSMVAMLSGAALWGVVGIRQIRGSTKPDDIVIPLALLGSHAYPDTIWAIMWSNVLAECLASVLIVSLLILAVRPRASTLVAAGFATVFLAFQGGPGLLSACGFLGPLTIFAIQLCRGEARVPRRVLLSIAAVAGTVLCLVSFEILVLRGGAPTGHGTISLFRLFAVAVRILALGGGALPELLWALGTVVVGGGVACVVGCALRKDQPWQFRCLVAAALMLPGLFVCVGLAMARGGTLTRYVGMVMPLTVALYAGLVVVAPERVAAPISRSLLVLLAISFGFTLTPAIEQGVGRRAATAALMVDIAAGHNLSHVAADHASYWMRLVPESYEDSVAAISRVGRNDYSRIPQRPALAFEDVPSVPTETVQCHHEGEGWRIDEGAKMYFDLGGGSFDAVCIAISVSGYAWDMGVAGGACRSEDPTRWGPDLHSRRLNGLPSPAGGEWSTVAATFVFDAPADGFAFVPPVGAGLVKIISVRGGRFR